MYFTCNAQFPVRVVHTDAPSEFAETITVNSPGKEDVNDALGEYVQRLRSQGYLLANLDSVGCEASDCQALIYVGNLHRWLNINVEAVPDDYLKKAGVKFSKLTNTPVNLEVFERDLSRLRQQAAIAGYPLAELSTDSLRIVDGWVDLNVRYEGGQQYVYDSLTPTPQIVKPGFLAAYLSVRPGDIYNQRDVDRIPQLISQTGYMSLDSLPQQKFHDGSVAISLSLRKLRANKIDAIIGLLPNGSGALTLSGYVDLNLKNLFKSGKELNFLWRQYDRQSQLLNIRYIHPNLFRSPVGIDFAFNLLKQDTTFLDRNIAVQGISRVGGLNLNFGVDFISSRRINDTSLDDREVVNFDLQYVGAGINYSKLDNIFNPQSGHMFDFSLGVGNKRLRGNLPPDSISPRSLQFRITGGGQLNVPLGGPFVLNANADGGLLLNSEALFLNDLFRLGGLKSLRGFNELEFYTDRYVTAGVELRLLINRSSRLFAFYDQGFLGFLDAESGRPFGFGLGMMLGLGNGNLQLIYALGKSTEQSLSLSQGKVHLGYVAQF